MLGRHLQHNSWEMCQALGNSRERTASPYLFLGSKQSASPNPIVIPVFNGDATCSSGLVAEPVLSKHETGVRSSSTALSDTSLGDGVGMHGDPYRMEKVHSSGHWIESGAD